MQVCPPPMNVFLLETSSGAESQIREGSALAPWVHPFVWYEHDAGLDSIRSPAPESSTSEQLASAATLKRLSHSFFWYVHPYLTFPDSLEHTSGDNPHRSRFCVFNFTGIPLSENYRIFLLGCNFFLILAVLGNWSVVDLGKECDRGVVEWKCKATGRDVNVRL